MTCISPAPRAGCAIIQLPSRREDETYGAVQANGSGLPSVTAPEGSYFKELGTAFRRDDEVNLCEWQADRV